MLAVKNKLIHVTTALVLCLSKEIKFKCADTTLILTLHKRHHLKNKLCHSKTMTLKH